VRTNDAVFPTNEAWALKLCEAASVLSVLAALNKIAAEADGAGE
jgi:hypothetical protein